MNTENDFIPEIPRQRKIRKHGYADRTKCETCQYSGVTAALTTCDYSLHTKASRGCSVEDCDKYKPLGKRSRQEIVFRRDFYQPKDKVQPWHTPKSELAKFSRAAAWTMYKDGASDHEIARALGCGSTPIRNWRTKFNLPANAIIKRAEAKAKHDKQI